MSEEQHLTAVLVVADDPEALVERINELLSRDGFTNLAAAYAHDGKHYGILEVQGAPKRKSTRVRPVGR